MFRDTYKQACDDIKPREGLLADILKEAKTTKIKPKRNFKVITAYAASVAAVFVIAAAVVVYPNMLKNHNDQQRANSLMAQSKSDAIHTAGNAEADKLEEGLNEKTAEQNTTYGVLNDEAGDANVMPSGSANPKNAEDYAVAAEPSDAEDTAPVADTGAGYEDDASVPDNTNSAVEARIVTPVASESTEPVADAEADSADGSPAQLTLTADEDEKEAVDANASSGGGGGASSAASAGGAGGGSSVKATKTGISEADALNIAKAAFVGEYESVSCSYDSEGDMWCVRFVSGGENVCSVYITGDGIINKME